jgi:hypothetical protein
MSPDTIRQRRGTTLADHTRVLAQDHTTAAAVAHTRVATAAGDTHHTAAEDHHLMAAVEVHRRTVEVAEGTANRSHLLAIANLLKVLPQV